MAESPNEINALFEQIINIMEKLAEEEKRKQEEK
jgi:hypothetical protein